MEEREVTPQDEVLERVVRRCRTDAAVACWADRRNVEIVHFYHREGVDFVLQLGSRNFSPYPANYEPKVKVSNAVFTERDDAQLIVSPSLTLIDGATTMLSLGIMEPSADTVVTRVNLSDTSSPSSPRSPLPSQIDLESVVDPENYECPCCSG